jgi:hypothetical protein
MGDENFTFTLDSLSEFPITGFFCHSLWKKFDIYHSLITQMTSFMADGGPNSSSYFKSAECAKSSRILGRDKMVTQFIIIGVSAHL